MDLHIKRLMAVRATSEELAQRGDFREPCTFTIPKGLWFKPAGMDTHQDDRIQPWKAVACNLGAQESQSEPHSRLAETNAFQKGEHIVIGGQGLPGNQKALYDTDKSRSTSSSSRPKDNQESKNDTKYTEESKSSSRPKPGEDSKERRSG